LNGLSWQIAPHGLTYLYFYTVKTTVLTTKEIIKDKPGEGISIFYLTDFLLLFIYSHMRTLFGSFLHLALLPKLSPPPQFQAGPILPLSQILLKKRHKYNKEDKVFFLVELRIAI
jgi:hypothetical protein